MSRPIPPTEGNPDSGSAPMEDAEDVAIVRRILLGERDLFRILVERHQDHVYRLALRLSNGDRDRAADLAQDAFLRAYRGLAGFAFDAKFSTWLHRVAVNCAISEKRRERASKRGRALSLDAPASAEGDEAGMLQVPVRGRAPSAEVVGEEARQAVMSAIDELEDDLRVLVILVNLEEHSYESAAQILSIPVGTVRSRLHRARAILEQKLRKYLRP